GLSILTAVLFSFQAVLEITRGRLLLRIGNQLDCSLSSRVYDLVVRLPLRARAGSDALQPVRDVDTVRAFLSSLGPAPPFALPWIPLYVAICFAFHPLIGLTVLGGAIILVGLTLATEFLSRSPIKAATAQAASRNRLAEISRRNADVLTAMGMSESLRGRWLDLGREPLAQPKRVNEIGGGVGAGGRGPRVELRRAGRRVGGLPRVRP